MKDYKWGKALAIVIVSALVGAVVGGGLQTLENIIQKETLAEALNQFAPNLFLVAFVCGIIGIAGYFYFNHLFKKDGYSNEEGSLFEQNQNKMSVVMLFSTVCAIINFTAFGVNLLNDLNWIYMIIFIANVVLSFMGEVASISLMKKVRPELNADPVDLGFKKEYFDKLDECEKIQVGKVSYKTMTAMVVVYVSVFVVCWLLIMAFEISPIVCLPVGILWFMQTVILGYHSCKQK